MLAGPIVDHLSYHWLFWIPLVMTALATVATFLFVPESPVKTPGTVNFGARRAALGLAGGAAARRQRGLGLGLVVGPRSLGLFVAAAILFAAWVAVELRSRVPLVDVRLMRTPVVWWTNVSAFLFGFGMYSMMVVLPEFMEAPQSGRLRLRRVGHGRRAGHAPGDGRDDPGRARDRADHRGGRIEGAAGRRAGSSAASRSRSWRSRTAPSGRCTSRSRSPASAWGLRSRR